MDYSDLRVGSVYEGRWEWTAAKKFVRREIVRITSYNRLQEITDTPSSNSRIEWRRPSGDCTPPLVGCCLAATFKWWACLVRHPSEIGEQLREYRDSKRPVDLTTEP